MAGLPPSQSQAPNRAVLLLGKPLAHSLSPLMQNAAFRALGLSVFYAPLELELSGLKSFFPIFRSSNLLGANVTVPYKEAVIPYLDGLEKEAAWLGSVNTLYKKQGKLWGASTDGEGFLFSLGSRRRRLPKSRGLLLGAGGAAKAVAGALAGAGLKGLFIANRTPGRAERLRRLVQKRHPRLEVGVVSMKEAQALLPRMDWVVQATSMGLKPGDPSPLSLAKAPGSLWVADLIYHRSTAFLREAKRRGLPGIGGAGMLLYQGALAFEKWTGRKAPLAVMRQALRNALR
ncbi:MAG TPA: shikimate dehydrogenase [bacterium]|nr:shikimate dehydrogenase [bacterium]